MQNSTRTARLTRFRRLLMRTTALVLLGVTVLVFWCSTEGVALAKKKGAGVPAAAPPSKDYVFPYTLVILSVAMGLMLVCRPTRRATEPKWARPDED